MNFKTFFKKVNRGLVLGSVVLVGFVVYVAVDTASFKSQKPKLEDMVYEYFDDLSTLCVTPEKYRNSDSVPKDDDELSSSVNEFLDKYWTDSNINTDIYYGMNKNNAKDNFTMCLSGNTEGYVTEWFYNVDNVNVKKTGPNIATITYDLSINATYYGDSYVFTGADVLWCSYSNYYGANEDYSIDDEFKVYYNTDNTVTLNKVNGEWKIAYTQFSGYKFDISSAEDMEVTE